MLLVMLVELESGNVQDETLSLERVSVQLVETEACLAHMGTWENHPDFDEQITRMRS